MDNSLDFHLYTHAPAFAAEHLAWLCLRESEYNLIIGLAQYFARVDQPIRALVLSQNARCLGLAFKTEQDPTLSLTDIDLELLPALIEQLRSHSIRFDNVTGPARVVACFARLWALGGFRLTMNQAIYELTRLNPPDLSGGYLKQATPEDLAVATGLIGGFVRDYSPEDSYTPDELTRQATSLIRLQTLYLWCTDAHVPVAMAAVNRESPHSANISYAYTPPAERGNAYGSRVTAALCRHLLAQGKQSCNAYTDLSNPISNALCLRLGFRKIAESQHYSFVDP